MAVAELANDHGMESGYICDSTVNPILVALKRGHKAVRIFKQDFFPPECKMIKFWADCYISPGLRDRRGI